MSLSAYAVCPTVLKRSPKQSVDLKPEEKFYIGGKWSAPIAAYTKEGNHYLITLGKLNGKQLSLCNDGGCFNSFYVYAPHMEIKQGSRVVSSVATDEIKLKVPYFTQRNNYIAPNATCNSSSNAMCLAYLKPGVIKGDNEYLAVVEKIGRERGQSIVSASTDHSVQLEALKRFGLNAEFTYAGNYGLLDSQLEKGIPVAIGILHRGLLSYPTGGHILVVIGKGKGFYWVHDPYGDLLTDYCEPNGEGLEYPVRQLDYRWLCDGANSGWMYIYKP